MSKNTKLSGEKVTELRKTLNEAIEEIMNDAGNIAYIQGAAKKLVLDMNATGKAATPEELVVHGTFLGYALKMINLKEEN